MQIVLTITFYIIVAIVKGATLLVALKQKGIVQTKKLYQNIRHLVNKVKQKRKEQTIFQYTKRTESQTKKTTLKKRGRPRKAMYAFSVATKLKYFALGAIFSFIFLFLPLAAFIFLQELPNPADLSGRPIAQTTKIYDRNGTLLYEVYASQNRTLVKLKDIPPHLRLATLAIEDKNFYTHPGFDIPSIIRAAKENATGGTFQGGSTLTQQLIKSSMLTPEQSITRKIKEITLAFWAERMYTKDQILEMYFNQIPYGGTSWGVQAASESYFGKPVKELTLAESAFLAGITAAPTLYSPYGDNPTLWKTRQKEVLKRMLELGYISKKDVDNAEKEKITFRKQEVPLKAPHFVNYVISHLAEKYGLATIQRGGLNVTTTLDLPTHNQTQKIVTEEVKNYEYLNLTNGAALVTDPSSGDILAMVGSKDYDDPKGGNVNVTTALRQPGSSIKVVTYAAALLNGMTAATPIEDAPITYKAAGSEPYSPVNYDGRYYGRVPLRFALANSLNIPAVKILDQVGVEKMVGLARDMGIKNWPSNRHYGLSTTLGGAEVTMTDMAGVFGTLANNGRQIDLDPILKITNSSGQIIERKEREEGRRVLPESVAFIISDILSDNTARSVAFGTNSPLNIPGHKVSVKTGTTDNKRDNWTVGYTDKFVVTVWVGNNDNTPMSQNLASGITGAAPIWHRIMTQLVEKKPATTASLPPDIVQRECYGRTEYFITGSENSVNCTNTRYQFRDQQQFRN
jgi:1A family penicillin-binding protein